MSTHATINRLVSDDYTDTPLADGAHEGTYVHYDGYPTECGRHLYTQIADYHRGDLRSADTYFFKLHRWGFSNLKATPADNDCYCHVRAEINFPSHGQLRRSEEEWTYVITRVGLVIAYESVDEHLTLPWARSAEVLRNPAIWEKVEGWFFDPARRG